MSRVLECSVVLFHVVAAVYAATERDTALTVFFCGMMVTYELIGIEWKLKALLDRLNEEAGHERKG